MPDFSEYVNEVYSIFMGSIKNKQERDKAQCWFFADEQQEILREWYERDMTDYKKGVQNAFSIGGAAYAFYMMYEKK